MEIIAEVKELGGRKFLLELSNRSEVFGPFSKAELTAILEGVQEWLEELEY